MPAVLSKGLDCDAPLNAKLIPAEFEFVLRYAPPHDNPLTRAEVLELTAAGKAVGILCEHSVDDVAGGAAAGTAMAEQWVASAHEDVGAVTGAALILACDEDPTAAVVAEGIAFYRASTKVIRAASFLSGAYGGHDLMVSLSPIVDVLFQSGAWSGGVLAPGIDMFQEIESVFVGNVECDVDVAYSKSFGLFNANGLWPHVAPPSPKPPTPKPPAPKPAPKPSPTPEDDVHQHPVKIGPIPQSGEAVGILEGVTIADVVGSFVNAGAGGNDPGHESLEADGSGIAVTIRGARAGTTVTVVVTATV